MLSPDVNSCFCAFTVSDNKSILYGLGAVKGVGAAAVEAIVEERKQSGGFKDLFDFCCRVDTRKVNRRAMEALIRCGAMDGLGPGRATLMASLALALTMAEKHVSDRAAGQDDLFGELIAGPAVTTGAVNGDTASPGPFVEVAAWSEDEVLVGEKETLGLYLTGHPINKYEQELAKFTSARIVDLKPTHDQTVIVAGLVVALRTLNSRRGERIAFVTLDDRSGRIELAVFAENYRRYRDLLAKDKLLVVEGTVSVDEYSGGFRMSAERIMDIDQARALYAKGVQINIDTRLAGNGFVKSLAHTLEPFRASACPVRVHYYGSAARADLQLGQDWRVNPTDELLCRLGELAGRDRVCVLY